METVIDMPYNKVVNKSDKSEYKQFLADLARGYLEVEIMEKQKQLKEFSNAYNEMNDKDSFNAEYLGTLIDNLSNELKII